MPTCDILFQCKLANYEEIIIENINTRKNFDLIGQDGNIVNCSKNIWKLKGGEKFKIIAPQKSSTRTIFRININF